MFSQLWCCMDDVINEQLQPSEDDKTARKPVYDSRKEDYLRSSKWSIRRALDQAENPIRRVLKQTIRLGSENFITMEAFGAFSVSLRRSSNCANLRRVPTKSSRLQAAGRFQKLLRHIQVTRPGGLAVPFQQPRPRRFENPLGELPQYQSYRHPSKFWHTLAGRFRLLRVRAFRNSCSLLSAQTVQATFENLYCSTSVACGAKLCCSYTELCSRFLNFRAVGACHRSSEFKHLSSECMYALL